MYDFDFAQIRGGPCPEDHQDFRDLEYKPYPVDHVNSVQKSSGFKGVGILDRINRINRILGLEYKPYPVDHVNPVKTAVALKALGF